MHAVACLLGKLTSVCFQRFGFHQPSFFLEFSSPVATLPDGMKYNGDAVSLVYSQKEPPAGARGMSNSKIEATCPAD